MKDEGGRMKIFRLLYAALRRASRVIASAQRSIFGLNSRRTLRIFELLSPNIANHIFLFA